MSQQSVLEKTIFDEKNANRLIFTKKKIYFFKILICEF